MIAFWLFTGEVHGQAVVFNEKLFEQLTKNQTVREVSNQAYLSLFGDQVSTYNNMEKKTASMVVMQDAIYKNLTEISLTLKQGKQVEYIYKYAQEVTRNLTKLTSVSLKNPQYAALRAEGYNNIARELSKLSGAVLEEAMKEHRDHLIDPYDRQLLIEKVLFRMRMLNGYTVYLIILLERAQEISLLRQLPGLQNYINQDRVIIEDILQKYNTLKL